MLFRSSRRRSISLALQGGGAHGAFTWGVLDALLEDGRFVIEGVSGTSAGAMNAVVLAHGLLQGGNEGAREALARFWEAVADCAPMLNAGADSESGRLASAIRIMLYWTQQFSPQQFNPYGINPLRDIVSRQIDFDRLRERCPLKLFIAATHANTGRLRLFRTAELKAEMLLASACLPTLHHAILIDGEPYWDGAFAANPAVFPLVYEASSADILLVLLSPFEHAQLPLTHEEIHHRTQELAFKSTLLREMHSLALARQFAGRTLWPAGRLERRLSRTRMHLIDTGDLVGRLAMESKLTTSRSFLEMLRDQGRERTSVWLSEHGDTVGKGATADIARLFL
ncbi:esterase [Zobellella endophytica]|uniref:Esterase n=1 Tax=Zobellella endophytica TaxID=2116700 RepID=A0A2P7RBT9_9GAMM|nr:patatin-like phospholipase family protein [Zobellella endophytica]PSJ47685.1 esterase [Zobellella endophytica]